MLRFVVLLAILGILFWMRAAWWPPLMHQGATRALKNHDPETALVWLNRVDWLVSRDADTEILRAGAYRRLGEMEKCAESLKRALELGAQVERLRREEILAQAQSGQMREAAPHLSRLLRDRSNDPTEVTEAYVMGYLRIQRHSEALELLNAWIADAPDDPQPFLLRGQIRRLRRETDAAEGDLRRALELEKDNLKAALELGEILLSRNQPNEAAPLFEKCLQDPGLGVSASISLAECLKSAGDSQRALSLLKSAVEKEPKNAKAHRELGRSLFEQGDYSSAVQTLNIAIELAPRDDESHYLLAQALSLSGQTEKAEPHFDYVRKAREAFDELDRLNDVLVRTPGDAEAMVRAGELLLQYGDANEAVLRLLAAIDIEPKNAKALRLLADHYTRRAAIDSEFQALADEFTRRANAQHAAGP